MSHTQIERLRDYLAQLPPQSQALLMREFERAIERGQDVAVATLVLEQLRGIARDGAKRQQPEVQQEPRTANPGRRLFYEMLEPFLIDGNSPARIGQIRRASLQPIWQWLERTGAPEQVRELDSALAALAEGESVHHVDPVVRKLQRAAADAVHVLNSPAPGVDRQRALARVGPPEVIEDLTSIGTILEGRDALDGLTSRLPAFMRTFGDSQIAAVSTAMNVPSLQTPKMLPFALSLIIRRMAAPWQIIRLAVKMAASDDEIRVAATPYGVAITIALHDLSCLATKLRMDIKRGHFENVAEHLKSLHDGVRGLRTELDFRSESNWGKQLTAIRAEISNALQSEIETVPGRVRRILRQRAEKDIPPGAHVNSSEVEETAALIDFVATCRTYASELAINEVTLRTFSELQQYVEKAMEALVQSLRAADPKVRVYRQMQVAAAIRFCEVLFGQEYASLMSRAAENASQGERKPSRAGGG
ncbi:MAG: hypothetical protein HY852_00655 [Bradyrhizobium sp.]|uniref:hypothetical protein n=1 Tax=Bradyrhizobium sp. TaxID=376 RepID=UPI0025BC4E5D|nr:hypothetical protein [Bradyrhizobium sp.]MBI5260312.1 hypothetical protein [Bradyrhizobium sp.]